MRMLLGRNASLNENNAANIIFCLESLPPTWQGNLNDVVDAVTHQCSTIGNCLKYLQRECQLCLSIWSTSKVTSYFIFAIFSRLNDFEVL